MSEQDYSMRSIPIRNPELIEILDRYVALRTDDQESFERWMRLSCSNQKHRRHHWCGDNYLEDLIQRGRGHDGFPEAMVGYEFRVNNKDHTFFKNQFAENEEEASFRNKFHDGISECNTDMMQWMGCRNNALSACYPPGGYISWHNNANASAWNFIFSYSENGKGHFKYWDVKQKKVVIMKDKPGWQLKAGYFGHYGEPDQLFYHAAESDCWRQTVSFCFDRSPESELYREQIIEEIMSE